MVLTVVDRRGDDDVTALLGERGLGQVYRTTAGENQCDM